MDCAASLPLATASITMRGPHPGRSPWGRSPPSVRWLLSTREPFAPASPESAQNLDTILRLPQELIEKGQFAALALFCASVIHELSSPLDSALDLIEMSKGSRKLHDVKKEYLPMIRESL